MYNSTLTRIVAGVFAIFLGAAAADWCRAGSLTITSNGKTVEVVDAEATTRPAGYDPALFYKPERNKKGGWCLVGDQQHVIELNLPTTVTKIEGSPYHQGSPDWNGMFLVTNSATTGARSDADNTIYYYQKITYGFLGPDGRYVIPAKYDKVGVFSEGLVAVSLDGKIGGTWGFIDQSGNVVIHYSFSGASKFSEGLAAVKNDKGYGFIDRTGKFVIPAKYPDTVGDFSEGLASAPSGRASWGGKYGFIDKAGEWRIEAVYDAVYPFREGLASVCKDKKWGVIDHDGKMVIALQYDEISEFYDGLAFVKMRPQSPNDASPDGWHYDRIDKKGNLGSAHRVVISLPDHTNTERHDTYWITLLDEQGQISQPVIQSRSKAEAYRTLHALYPKADMGTLDSNVPLAK